MARYYLPASVTLETVPGTYETVIPGALTPLEDAPLMYVNFAVATPGDVTASYTISSFQEMDTATSLASSAQSLDVSIGGQRARMNGPSVSTYDGSRTTAYGRRISLSYTVPTNALTVSPVLSVMFVWNI